MSLGCDLDLRMPAFRAVCYVWYRINEMKGCVLETREVVLRDVLHRISEMKGCVLETHEVVLCDVWHRISEMKGCLLHTSGPWTFYDTHQSGLLLVHTGVSSFLNLSHYFTVTRCNSVNCTVFCFMLSIPVCSFV
jgi:hypothetical protein